MKQVLVILRGAPSSGKSTLAKKLRDYDKKIVWLKVDNFKPFFSDNTDIIVDDVNKTAINSLSYLLDQGFSVIMEGIFQNPKYIQQAVDLAVQKNIPVFVYQLECPLKTLQERDKTREGIKEGCRKPLGDDVIERLFNIIENNSFKNIVKLNTEQKSFDECLVIIKINFDYGLQNKN